MFATAPLGTIALGLLPSVAVTNVTGAISWTEQDDVVAITGIVIIPVIATIGWTEANDTVSITGTVTASDPTIITPALKNNTGTVLANETGITVHIYDITDSELVVTKTGQTTNASGVMTVSDALLVDATEYRIVIVLGSGAEGMERLTAS